MMPSTTQNRTEEPSWPLIRLVSPTGTRKNRTMASTRATTIVPAHTPLEISSGSSLSSSESCALADTSSARKPIAIEPPSATTPRTIGSRSRRWRRRAESSGKVLTSIFPERLPRPTRPPRCRARGPACARPPPSWRRRASSRPRARPGRPAGRRAGAKVAVLLLHEAGRRTGWRGRRRAGVVESAPDARTRAGDGGGRHT